MKDYWFFLFSGCKPLSLESEDGDPLTSWLRMDDRSLRLPVRLISVDVSLPFVRALSAISFLSASSSRSNLNESRMSAKSENREEDTLSTEDFNIEPTPIPYTDTQDKQHKCWAPRRPIVKEENSWDFSDKGVDCRKDIQHISQDLQNKFVPNWPKMKTIIRYRDGIVDNIRPIAPRLSFKSQLKDVVRSPDWILARRSTSRN